MSTFELTEYQVEHTLVVNERFSHCMRCGSEYMGGASCVNCETHFLFIVVSYPDPNPEALKAEIEKFIHDERMDPQVQFLGRLTKMHREVTTTL